MRETKRPFPFRRGFAPPGALPFPLGCRIAAGASSPPAPALPCRPGGPPRVLLLGHVYLRRDNKQLAKRLLRRFGSIAGVLAASDSERRLVEGCGEAVDSFCALMREIIARSAQSAVQRKQALDIADILRMGRERLGLSRDEEVWAVLLDKQNRLLTYSRIRHGSFDRVELEPLELVSLMLRHKASSIVLMHNHPGGSFRPSLADRELTGRIDAALKHLGLHLHDHVIITPEQCFSITLDRCIDQPRP